MIEVTFSRLLFFPQLTDPHLAPGAGSTVKAMPTLLQTMALMFKSPFLEPLCPAHENEGIM